MPVPAPTQPPLSPDQPGSPCSVHSEPLPALRLQNTVCGYNYQATHVPSVQSPSPRPGLAAQMSEGPKADESPSCADQVALGEVLGVLSLGGLTCTWDSDAHFSEAVGRSSKMLRESTGRPAARLFGTSSRLGHPAAPRLGFPTCETGRHPSPRVSICPHGV